MKNLMIDLETMGTSTDSAITSIAAVEFDETGTGKKFYRKVSLASSVEAGLQMDVSTILWWMENDKNEARAEMISGTTSLKEALLELSSFISVMDMRVWGNGADFDNVLLANAYRKCGIVVPWNFRNNRCFRTLKSLFPSPATVKGIKHSALDDAINQATQASEILKKHFS